MEKRKKCGKERNGKKKERNRKKEMGKKPEIGNRRKKECEEERKEGRSGTK